MLIRSIRGFDDGDEDEKEVYKINTENRLGENTIRNKYLSAKTGKYQYFTEETVNARFQTSSREEYRDKLEAEREANSARNAEAMDKKLRAQYENEFKEFSPEMRGDETSARRAGWMTFMEWKRKKASNNKVYGLGHVLGGVIAHVQVQRRRRAL